MDLSWNDLKKEKKIAFVVALYINAGDTQGLTSVQIFDLVLSPLSASIMCL